MGNHQQRSGKSFVIWDDILSYISTNQLAFICLGAVALGIVTGVILDIFEPSKEAELYLSLPIGFMEHMVKVESIPLMITSLILGIGSFKAAPSKNVALLSGLYFIFTTLTAVTIGVVLVVFVKPGVTGQGAEPKDFLTINIFQAFIRRFFPDGMLRSFVKNQKLVLKEDGYGVDILSLFLLLVLFGLAFNEMKEQSKTIVQMVCSISAMTTRFFKVIRCYLPVGVLFMTICAVLDDPNGWNLVFQGLKFIAVVATGFFVHVAIILPLVYLVFTHRNPIPVIRGVFPALWTAFVLSSSAPAMPVIASCCKNTYTDHRITRYMLLVSSNMSNSGTALYEAAAAVFIAQLSKTYLDFNLLVTIAVSAAVFSSARNRVPACGAMMSLFVLNAAMLPLSDAWILVAIEWILDHFASVVSILADYIGIALVQELSRNDPDLHQKKTRTEEFGTAAEEKTPSK